jgi:6,7-dimethyl-8-ribityllumazine synthase
LRDPVRVDLVSLAAGGLIAALGALILLDSAGALDIPLGWMAVALTAAVGAICLLSGLVDGDSSRHD